MNSIKEFVLNEYENLEFEKILVETFLYFINEEYVDDISVTDLLEVIEESNVNLKEEPIVQLMYESVKDKPTQTEKKAEALTAKKEVIKDKIENLQASKEKIDPKDKIAKAEVNVEILQNKEKGAEIAVAKDKLLDKDSSNNEEKAKEYKEATGIATDLVKIKKEKIESEDDPEKKAVLKSLETQKSLELKAVTTELTPEDKERLKKSQEDVEKKLKEIEDKKSEEESKEDTDSEEENDDDVKDYESKDDESKEDEDDDDKNSKEIEKLTVEIESLKDQIDSSKKQEDDILEALKEKTDALADSERLQRLVMKKRLDNKIEFTEM
jgi:hypothetical protein